VQPLKQDAIDLIAHLPDDADVDEIMYRLYVLDKVRKGRAAIEQGRTVSHEELKREIEQW
jgi:predicted transcriptional regulator